MAGLNTGAWAALDGELAPLVGGNVAERRPVSGGCVSESWHLVADRGEFFLKVGDPGGTESFEAEADGLAALAAGGVRTPAVLGCGETAGRGWLLLEYLPLRGLSSTGSARLGETLAALHGAPGEQFGWHRDNFIGGTAQPNGVSDDWVAFYRERRLAPQLRLAATRGAPRALAGRGARLLERLPALFSGYRPHPALLHGDLWGGNAAALPDGTPVLFDPAVYRGDREADLAMSELFGGFPPAFYAAYDAALPRDTGYTARRDLYHLYHLLNHHNLFGGGYGRQALACCERLLAALG